MKQTFITLNLLFFYVISTAQITYYSKASATDFNDVNSWGTNAIGGGASPAIISNADNFIIQNNANFTLNGNAKVRSLTINAGTLNVANDTLLISIANANNTEFNLSNGALLNLSNNGVIDVRGAVYFSSGSGCNQTGGLLTIDGNSGVAATSIGGISSNVPILGIGHGVGGVTSSISDSTKFNIQAGIIRIVNPLVSTSSIANAFSFKGSKSIKAGIAHVMEFGDGISMQSSGYVNGFQLAVITGTTSFSFGNIVINTGLGINRKVYSSNIIIQKNLTILSGEFQNAGITYIAGNINNEGILTSTSTLYFGKCSSNVIPSPATLAQEVSGDGVFKNATVGGVANFSNISINNSSLSGVVFSNANSLLSTSNTGTVSGNLTFVSGLITTNGNVFILGTATNSIGSLTHSSGGFSSGSTFSRWVGLTTGSLLGATQPSISSNTGSFPFSSKSKDRTAFIAFNNATTGGKVSVTYNSNGSGAQTKNIIDGTYNITTQSKDSWTFSQSNITGLSGCAIGFNAQGLYFASNGNSRVTFASVPAVGFHQTGTSYPHAQRALLFSDLVNTYYIGAASADLPCQTANSGSWKDATTWNRATPPSCTDAVTILTGHDVIVNTPSAVCKSMTINTGSKLTISNDSFNIDLTIGCTNKNNSLICNGFLEILSGKLYINGKARFNQTASFYQFGGDILVDGNAAGVIANSATGILFDIFTSNINLVGGKILFIDPHAGGFSSDQVFNYASSPAVDYKCGDSHYIQFGNGISTDPGGNANGFMFSPLTSSVKFSPGNVRLDIAPGTNRIVTITNAMTIGNRIMIEQGEYRNTFNQVVGGVIINNGVLVLTGTLELSKGSSLFPSPYTQAIGGTGVFKNAITGSTGSLKNLNIYNNSTGGVWIAKSISVSGILGLYSGIVRVNSGQTLSLGTSTTAGTLNLGTYNPSLPPMIEGTFIRVFPANRIATGTYNTTTLFPVGTGTSYTPLWIDPSISSGSATSVGVKAVSPNANPIALGLTALSNTRWEYFVTSNLLTNAYIRTVSQTNAFNMNQVFVQADSANGMFNVIPVASNLSGQVMTTNLFPTNNMTGFLSYADKSIGIAAKVLLSNANPTTGLMDSYLKTLGSFPLSDPYVTAPLNTAFTHVNNPITATTTQSALNANAIVDWVFLELRTGVSTSTSVQYTKSALLQADGDIVDMDGVSAVAFPNAPNGNYYIAVRHRNHLGFRTANPVAISGATPFLNFTNGTVALSGNNPMFSVSTMPTVNVMVTGDGNFEGSIDGLDSALWEVQNGNFDDYLLNTDYNLDGSVDGLDSALWEFNNGKYQEID